MKEENLELKQKRQELEVFLKQKGFFDFWARRVSLYISEQGIDNLRNDKNQGLEQKSLINLGNYYGVRVLNEYLINFDPNAEPFSQMEQHVRKFYSDKVRFNKESIGADLNNYSM